MDLKRLNTRESFTVIRRFDQINVPHSLDLQLITSHTAIHKIQDIFNLCSFFF